MVLRLVTFNARGLLNIKKIDKVKQMCKQEDIILLQETNWREGCIKEMRGNWEGEFWYNNGDGRYGRGVAILIRENSGINGKEIYKDKVGKCMAVEITYEEKGMLLVNIHAPNEEKEKRLF